MIASRLVDLDTVPNRTSSEKYVTFAGCHYALMKSYLEILQGVEKLKADRWDALRSELGNIRNQSAASQSYRTNGASTYLGVIKWWLFYVLAGIVTLVGNTITSPLPTLAGVFRTCWRLYRALRNSLVWGPWGPLVQRQVRNRIRKVLRRLRALYIAERTSIDPASKIGSENRTLLENVTNDITDFLDRNTDVSNLPRNPAGGLVGAAVRLGVPGVIVYVLRDYTDISEPRKPEV